MHYILEYENMRIICVYTKEIRNSVLLANNAVLSGKKYGYDVELHPSVYWKDISKTLKELGLKARYKVGTSGALSGGYCPGTRMANGITHYKLYKECEEPICILEHDAVFVGKLPEPKREGVIQVSSHLNVQLTEELCRGCVRAQKSRKYEKDFVYEWPSGEGVFRHPLAGTNGTSGYIIGPGAAKKMVDVIESGGVGFADRLRKEYIGKDNLWIQKPQSVFICSTFRSHEVMR